MSRPPLREMMLEMPVCVKKWLDHILCDDLLWIIADYVQALACQDRKNGFGQPVTCWFRHKSAECFSSLFPDDQAERWCVACFRQRYGKKMMTQTDVETAVTLALREAGYQGPRVTRAEINLRLPRPMEYRRVRYLNREVVESELAKLQRELTKANQSKKRVRQVRQTEHSSQKKVHRIK